MKRWKRGIALLAIVAMMMQVLPINVWAVQFTMPSGLHSVLERPFSEANGRPFLVKRSPLIVC